MLKERLNIYSLKDDEKKMKFLLKMENDAILKGIIRLKSSNIDMLGDSKLNLL